jgi:dTDP-4-amino-4,6-dideoxygalactose transaminase
MKEKILFSGRAYNFNTKEIKYIVNSIKNADPLTQGKYLNLFENKLKKYLSARNVFVTSSAASALEIIAQLINLKKGDEVIVPAHTYCASAIPFARNGAKIIWADINFDTRTIDINDVKKKITKKTKAIVIVHLYGYAVDFNPFRKLVNRNKIFLIEDAAQAFGAEVNKKKVGTLGDFSCLSFHAQKNLTTLGEGGAICVKKNKFALKVKGLRHNGHASYKKRKYYWKPAMGNLVEDLKEKWPNKFTLSEPQCAAGFITLDRIDQMNNLRIKRAKFFITAINEITDKLNFNSKFNNRRHVYHLMTAFVNPVRNFNRDLLIERLYLKYGIQCIVQYYPLYKYQLFKNKGFGYAHCPQTEKFFNNMISFPFYIWMTQKNFNYMVKSVKNAVNDLTKKS